jgi:hypothetical protein
MGPPCRTPACEDSGGAPKGAPTRFRQLWRAYAHCTKGSSAGAHSATASTTACRRTVLKVLRISTLTVTVPGSDSMPARRACATFWDPPLHAGTQLQLGQRLAQIGLSSESAQASEAGPDLDHRDRADPAVGLLQPEQAGIVQFANGREKSALQGSSQPSLP